MTWLRFRSFIISFLRWQQRFVMMLLLVGCYPLAVAAEVEKGVVAVPRAVVDPINAGSVMQLLAGLIVVVGLILLLGWLVKRYSGLPGQNRALRVVASLPLTTREKLVLVQAGDQQLLLGVAPGRVNLLHSYDQPLIEPGVAMGEFASRLQQAISRKESE